MKKIVFIVLIVSSLSHAETFQDTEDLHLYSHLGLSYVLTMTCYGFSKKIFHLQEDEKWKALLFSLVFSTTAGIMRQVIVAPQGVPVNTKGIWYNAIGNGLAAGTILVFGF